MILAMTLPIWLSMRASAAPTLDLHALGEAGDEAALRGAGLGVAVGFQPWAWPASGPLSIEGLAEASVHGSGASHLSFRPELRLPVSPLDADRARLSLVAGYGLGLRPQPFPEGALGLALDIPGPGRVGVRIQGRYLLDGLHPTGFALNVGALWSRPGEGGSQNGIEAASSEAGSPLDASASEGALSVDPPDAKIWIPHPYCDWMSPDEVRGALSTLPPDVRLRVVAAGRLPRDLAADLTEPVVLEEAPRQGSLIVAARPGDQVLIDGRPIAVGSDGVTIISAPEGVIRVSVRGGGRLEEREAAVGTGLALWLRVPDPRPTRVQFDLSSSVVREAERAQIARIADLSEGWRFEVQGSASPEGDLGANFQLADARSRAVAGLLIRSGVPAERVTVLGAVVGQLDDEITDPALLRYATIRAIPAEVAP